MRSCATVLQTDRTYDHTQRSRRQSRHHHCNGGPKEVARLAPPGTLVMSRTVSYSHVRGTRGAPRAPRPEPVAPAQGRSIEIQNSWSSTFPEYAVLGDWPAQATRIVLADHRSIVEPDRTSTPPTPTDVLLPCPREDDNEAHSAFSGQNHRGRFQMHLASERAYAGGARSRYGAPKLCVVGD